MNEYKKYIISIPTSLPNKLFEDKNIPILTIKTINNNIFVEFKFNNKPFKFDIKRLHLILNNIITVNTYFFLIFNNNIFILFTKLYNLHLKYRSKI